jgi:hypothetical protein
MNVYLGTQRVVDLQDICTVLNISTYGAKDKLLLKIKKYIMTGFNNKNIHEFNEYLEKLKVVELQEICRTLKISPNGTSSKLKQKIMTSVGIVSVNKKL